MTKKNGTPRVAGAASVESDLTSGAITHGNKASQANGQHDSVTRPSAVHGTTVHPAADLFPIMSDEELEDLAKDIKKNGLAHPIVWDKRSNVLLDGRNRVAACAIAGVKPHFQQYTGDDPIGFIVSSNLHRRHLTPEQKRHLIAKLVEAKPELSDRQLGKLAKSSKNTVASVRTEMEARGQIDHVEKRRDSKGREQPAKKSKSKSAPKPKDTRAVIAEEIVAFVDETVKDEASVSAEKRKAEYAVGLPNGASTVALVSFKEAAVTFLPVLTEDDLKTARKFVLSAEWHRGQPS